MPELPEVETIVRALRAPLVGRTFSGLLSDWPRHCALPAYEAMQQRIVGQQVTGISRRGKFLLFELGSGDTLIVHLRMSGHLAVVDAHQPRHPHDHTVFRLVPLADEGVQELRFRDQRKFGRVYLVADLDEVLAGLGPEPLDAGFSLAQFEARLQRSKRVIKTLLLDQTFLAGVGNIYADEALFYAGIRPTRKSDTLTPKERAALYEAIRQVLNTGIEREGASVDLYLKPDGSKGDMQNAVAVYGRTGQPCLKCGAPIERISLNGRGTHFCPACQN